MNCFSSGAIVRIGGSQSCIDGAPSAKYSLDHQFINNQITLKDTSCYYQLPKALFDKELSLNNRECILWMYMFDVTKLVSTKKHTVEKIYVHLSHDNIEKAIGIKPSSTSEYIKKLEKLDLLDIELQEKKVSGFANKYYVKGHFFHDNSPENRVKNFNNSDLSHQKVTVNASNMDASNNMPLIELNNNCTENADSILSSIKEIDCKIYSLFNDLINANRILISPKECLDLLQSYKVITVLSVFTYISELSNLKHPYKMSTINKYCNDRQKRVHSNLFTTSSTHNHGFQEREYDFAALEYELINKF